MLDQKIKVLEQASKQTKDEVARITSDLSANTGKITAKKTIVRRIETNLNIHKKDLFDLENYKRRGEAKKAQLEAQVRRNDAEIANLKRQAERERITVQKY